ncbi:hypothetical protein BOTBODRAFT_153142 [Botryobasidium botryosum FD-172 SS1]|uniref:NAD-dependent epimerase/dehydratase domain-containing protein n=1 Tax=Botryobasidium botryosum (strain FD-172 SS1) TaxID=930990 RepID=A0A067N675_BOTB1|nr:hypothetical protein BOTBODRAFT_153142 [Botryobasidium botryosum FD-172 SS1]
MSPKPVILVTGGTGFLGSHIIDQLLSEGYTVRALVRVGRVSALTSMFPTAGSKLEVFEIADLATGDCTEALKGVGALVHVASISFTNGDPLAIFKGNVDCTLNIVKQAIGAGVKKLIATSSYIALFGPDFAPAFSSTPLTEKDWNSITADAVNDSTPPLIAYIAAKTVAERKFWELSEQHEDIDFTTIVPPGILGPLLKTFPRPSSRAGMSRVNIAYKLITGEAAPNTWPVDPVGNAVHVLDAARAHVLAVAAPPLTDGRKKRLIVASGVHTWQEAAELIRRERPELSSRLPKSELTPTPTTCAPLDTSLTEEVVGVKTWLPWEKAFLDSIDSALELWENGESRA